MQKIVLLIEPADNPFSTPLKICHLYMNRLAIDEDASFEISQIFELEKASWKMAMLPNFSDVPKDETLDFEQDSDDKGMSLIQIII